MSYLTIKSNNVPRFTVNWYELTAKEKIEFDYLDSDDLQACASFVRYRGRIYDLGEFMRIENTESAMGAWHGYASNSYFSGVLVKFATDYDCDSVIMATYYS